MKRRRSAQPDNCDRDAADLNRGEENAEQCGGENRGRHRGRLVVNGDDRFVTLACDYSLVALGLRVLELTLPRVAC